MRASVRVLPLLLLASTAPALSPKLSIRQYAHTAWTESAGQPLPAFHALAQMRDGYLWLAHNSGHLRFDGFRFSALPMLPGQSLPAGASLAITVARDGAAWLASDAGLSRVQNGRVTAYPFSWRGVGINAQFEDSSGAIWTAGETPAGPFVQTLSPRSGAVRRFGPADGLPPDTLVIQPDGASFWLGLDRAVCRWTPGSPAVCRPLTGAVRSLAPAGRGAVYAATPTAIYRVSSSRIETIVPALPHARIVGRRMTLTDRDGNLWVGTSAGIFRIRDGRVESLTRGDGLSGDFVAGLFEDFEGDIWIITNNGLDRLREPRVTHFSTPDGLSGELTTTVKATRDGSVWVGVAGSGLNRIRGASVSRFSTAEGLPGATVTALEEDAAGRLWVACGERLARFEGGRFHTIPSPVRAGNAYALSADADGAVWVAAETALWRVLRETVEAVSAGQPSDILRVFSSRAGPLWLGSTGAGVMALPVSRTAVSPPIPGLRGSRAIIEEPSGTVWVGAGWALSRIRGGKVTIWGSAEGLFDGEIYGLTADRGGNLWILTSQAVLRVALADLEKSRDGAPVPARFARYGSDDGLRLAENGGMPYPRITTAADGRIWFCERDGVGILDPDTLARNKIPPPVVIEQLSADGAVLSGAAPRFRASQLQITYTAISLMAPERLRFRYRLDRVPERWTDADGRRDVTYVELPPGSHRFLVTACNLDDVCNEAGAAVDFVVLPFYYQTLWFKFLVSAAAWAVIFGVYKLRMKQVESRYRLVARERARVTREIHDSILQGFAGVVLQLDAASRQFHSDPAASKERLDRALDQADESLREARQLLLDLRLPILEGRTLCEALAEVGETATRGAPIAFSLKVRGNERPLAYNAEVALYLIGREAIRNAVSHANPGRISVIIAFADRDCSLRVQDDGCGFDLETARRKPGHFGVQGMSDRAREAGASFRIDSAPGAGTTVEVVAPYKAGHPSPPM